MLQAVQFKEGDYVKAGQLLFQIDPRTFQASYNQAQAALARDRAQLENARVQQQRMEPLLKREFITLQEYDVAVTSAKSLEATVQAGQAQLEQAKIQLDYTRIHAPIAGRTGQLSVRAGNLVNASQGSGAPLVTINSTDPVLATFSIPERQLDEIRRALVKGEMRIEILADRSGARHQKELEQYSANISLAHAYIRDGAVDRALELLLQCPPKLRHWEWGRLVYLCHQEIAIQITRRYTRTLNGSDHCPVVAEFRLLDVPHLQPN